MADLDGTEGPEIDDVASRALACMILEAVADAINDDGALAAQVLQQLAEDTGLVLDVVAGLLYALTSLTAAGGLTSEMVFALSLTYQPDDTETLEGEQQ